MKLGIIGLPQSGKSTIFNALTGSERAVEMSAGRIEIHIEVVNVPDIRLDALADLYQSKKTVYAQISFADVAGLGSSEGKQALSGQLINALTGMDGLLLVLRAFENDTVPHPEGSVDAARDLTALLDELLLNDLIIVERKLERLAEERQKGGTDIVQNERQQALLVRLQEALADGRHLRDLELTEDEVQSVSGHGLITLKPTMVVLNLGEGQESPSVGSGSLNVLPLQGKLEMDLAQLSTEEAEEFLAEYELEERSAGRVIRAAYDLLNSQTFYTVAEKEAHAWILKRGGSALEAAHRIHSDIARGFIRAEVIGADELLELGDMAAARDAGKLRLEGKNYTMQDGDIINVRFNV